jgi:hypothetical protein
MKSLEIINSYKEQISWANECETIDLCHIWKDFYVMRHGNFWYVPYKWDAKKYWLDIQMFFQVTKVYALDYSDQAEKHIKLSVIFGGEMSIFEIEKVYPFLLENNISPFWEDVKSNLCFANFLSRISDGVDWQRTFIEFNADDPRILMEWDK